MKIDLTEARVQVTIYNIKKLDYVIFHSTTEETAMKICFSRTQKRLAVT